MGQKGNKHKTSSTGKVKDGRETNTTTNRNLVTQYVDVPTSWDTRSEERRVP